MSEHREQPGPERGLPRGDLTLLIERAQSGRAQAQEQLFTEVYRELRTIAASFMRHERPGHTLGATALVNESYLRLFGGVTPTEMSFAHRHAFFKAASVAMRRILIDHARGKAAAKRSPGKGRHVISADLEIASQDADPHDLMALDEALNTLEAEDKRSADVVQLRFYAGRSLLEIAEMLGVSERTIKRDWEFARARLQQLLDLPADRVGVDP
tara:strand:- start:30499 stop:31137 length:639 start_codon:yes stop_codon:yes gene_type:complete